MKKFFTVFLIITCAFLGVSLVACNEEPADETTPEPVDTTAAPAETPVNESVYTAEELAENHEVFKTSREIVEIALRIAGKKTATFAEATTIIEKFKHKEVK